jgi:hypothetical protein
MMMVTPWHHDNTGSEYRAWDYDNRSWSKEGATMAKVIMIPGRGAKGAGYAGADKKGRTANR